MNYLQHPYTFPGHSAVPMDPSSIALDPAMPHPTMLQTPDGYLFPYQPFDPVDFYAHPIMDYEEYAENMSRPRLTKEQVETLEAQFQAHPKPNSNVKRQLAAQTNLSLPRVANWFQNRRAKAKQQKRQEEFARMQKAKAEAEVAEPKKSGSTSNPTEQTQDSTTPKRGTDQETSTPKLPSTVSVSVNPAKLSPQSSSSSSSSSSTSSSSQIGNHKFAGNKPGQECIPVSSQQSVISTVSIKTEPSQEPEDTAARIQSSTSGLRASDCERSFAEWESIARSSVAWTQSQSPEQSFAYNNLNTTSFPSSTESLAISQLENLPYRSRCGEEAYMRMSFTQQPGEEWAGRPVSSHHGVDNAEPTHNAMSYAPSIQHPADSLPRRDSSDELVDSLEGVGIDNTKPYGLPQLSQRVDAAGSWKVPNKKIDLAARRKRPRPAAIGTCGSNNPRVAPASISPTARIPSFGPSQAVRHTKSAQSLNSRYAGVRKASATPRSPFNLPTFAETGALNSAKVEMSKRLRPSVSANTLAPTTPLTPDDFHSFMPTTPSDGAFYMPTTQAGDHLYSATAPSQANPASPPSTPLPVTTVAPFAYQNLAPPMSAPAHYTNFPDYITNLAMGSWTETAPEDASFQNSVHLPQSNVTSITYKSTVDQSGPNGENVSFSGSPNLEYSVKGASVPASTDIKNVTGFYIQGFPGQQGDNRFPGQELRSQKSKCYNTFNQQTPSDF